VADLRVVERPSPAEIEAIRALDARTRERTGHEALGAAAWRDLADPRPESFGIVDAGGDGRVHGYLHAAPADSTDRPHLQLAAVVDPDDPDAAQRLGVLAEMAAQELPGRTRTPATWWIAGADDRTDAALTAAGWRAARAQHQMRVPLPRPEEPKWPDGIVVRRMRPERDLDAWVAVNNRAFAGHPEQGGWTVDTLRRRIADPGFDPDDVIAAWAGHELAGFHWTKVHPASAHEPRTGEVYVLGVDPAHQGTGLGRALLVAGLDHLARARGCPEGMLYVAADNDAAIALYRGLGFTITRTDRAYEWP
jgi:mycothiol synthase